MHLNNENFNFVIFLKIYKYRMFSFELINEFIIY